MEDKVFKTTDTIDLSMEILKDSISYSKNINSDFVQYIMLRSGTIQDNLRRNLNNIVSVDKNNFDELNQGIIRHQIV